jgi:DNA-binding response OmpR family regulator
MILYLASDLIWATRIKSTAEDVGKAARPVRSLEMLEARLADSPVTALIVDLESPDVGLAMIRHLRAHPAHHSIRILCFAPHVKKDIMQEARDAGAHEVLPRGSFDHHLPDILLKL